MCTRDKLDDTPKLLTLWCRHFVVVCFVFGVATCLLWADGASVRAGESPTGFFAEARALPSNINNPQFEASDPRISADGLNLYFTRVLSSDQGYIYVAERNGLDEEFGEPVRLGRDVNSGPWAGMGSVTEDGSTIYFYGPAPIFSNGCCGTLFTATRESANEEFGNREELTEINSIHQLACSRAELCFDESPYISPNGLELFFSSFRVGNQMDLYKSTRANTSEPFVDVTPLAELSTGFDDLGATLSHDGLTLFFSGSTGWRYIPADRTRGVREGSLGESSDIWVATRPSFDEPFDNVMNLGPAVNSARGEEMPVVSADWPAPGSEIYFTRLIEEARGTGFAQGIRGQMQIWQATWYVPKGADLDGNDQLDIEDVDFLHMTVRDSWTNNAFDFDQSGDVDFEDVRHMIQSELGTYLGDSNLDGQFNANDVVDLLQAGEYDDGVDQNSTWATGDWNADGDFDRADIVLALQDGGYAQGLRAARAVYEAIQSNGKTGDRQTSLIYNAGTGELAVDAPVGVELTSINIDSASGIFIGQAAANLGGSFDNDADANIFKATFGSSFASLSFGHVAQAGLAEEFLLDDLTVIGSLAGGGDLGNVDLVYVPEPTSVLLMSLGLVIGLLHFRRRVNRSDH